MGRKRNDSERERLQKIAFNLFRTVGYDDTSFSDIAKASDSKRTLIQYYFPKKENLIYLYINKSLDLCAEIVDNSSISGSPVERLFCIGYLVFMSLYTDNQAEHITKAVLKDRTNTMMAIEKVNDWSVKYLGSDDPEYNQNVRDAITLAAGAGCELVYHIISEKRTDEVDPKYIARKVIRIAEAVLGEADMNLNIDSPELDAWVKEGCKEFNRRMY